MDLAGSQTIAADRQTVWAALNDPDVLKACIPGCQSLEKTEDGGFSAVVKQKIGPVSATFSGHVTLDNLNPPDSYTIRGEGKGGAAGFAKGHADVTLAEAEGGTALGYHVDASVGGKLAQLGGRVVDGVARRLADQFFTNFKAHVEGPQEGAAEGAAAGAASTLDQFGAEARETLDEAIETVRDAAGDAYDRAKDAVGDVAEDAAALAARAGDAVSDAVDDASKAASDAAETVQKKSWWKRLFG